MCAMGLPHPGQNAADSGMCAEQSGQERVKRLEESIFSAPYQNQREAANAEGISLRIVIARQTGTRAFCTDETSVIKFDPPGSSSQCLEGGERLQ